MARESFLLRTDPRILNALRRWAGDELRSVNGQVEFLLRRALIDAGRFKLDEVEADDDQNSSSSSKKSKRDR